MAGLTVGTLIGGAVVVEVIFSIPGMGLAISQAIFERQYVALQSFVAVLAILYVLVNFAVDVLHDHGTEDPPCSSPQLTGTRRPSAA